jgi:MFS family permease
MTQAVRTGAGARLFGPLIYGLILVSSAAQFALVPVMPVYAHRLGLSGFQQGMLLGATGLATLAVSVPAGTLADRLGARRITLAAGLLMAAATAAQACAGSFPALLAARLAFGAGYGIVWTAGLCWLVEVAGPATLGGSVASAGVGGVAGPAASGALSQHLGLAVPLLIGAAGFAVITAWLAALAVPPGPAASRPAASRPAASRPAASRPAAGVRLRAAARDRRIIGAAAAVVTAGLSTGVCALLVPAELHAAGASPGRIGLDFAAAGILFAIGSALTAAAGRRAVNLPVIRGGILAMIAGLSLGILSAAPSALIVMLCATTAARSVLWTVSYPMAAAAAERGGAGLGAAVGLLNGIWAATAVLGPLSAGLAAEHLGARAAFGLTVAACAAALAVTAAAPMARMPSWSRMKQRAAAGAAEPTGSSLVTAEEPGHDVIDTPPAVPAATSHAGRSPGTSEGAVVTEGAR